MKPVETAPFFNVEELQSRAGTKFISFAKSRQFQKELYEDLVAPHYESGDFFVETWRHGPGNIDSDCKKPSKVYNIQEISFPAKNFSFKTMHDHSKWMVSAEHNLICVGDINRQEHQKVRGGGTVCQEAEIATVYSKLIKAVEKCKKNKKKVRFEIQVEEIFN
jgi:deoxyribonuclease II